MLNTLLPWIAWVLEKQSFFHLIPRFASFISSENSPSNIWTPNSFPIDWFCQNVLTNIVKILRLKKVIRSFGCKYSNQDMNPVDITTKLSLPNTLKIYFQILCQTLKHWLSWRLPSIALVVSYTPQEGQIPNRKLSLTFNIKFALVFNII